MTEIHIHIHLHDSTPAPATVVGEPFHPRTATLATSITPEVAEIFVVPDDGLFLQDRLLLAEAENGEVMRVHEYAAGVGWCKVVRGYAGTRATSHFQGEQFRIMVPVLEDQR